MNGSTWCLAAFALVLSLDYSITLISLQPYWLALHGPRQMEGFTFGCYDVFPMFVAPLLAVTQDYSCFRFRTIFLICGLANCAGNVAYALAGLFNRWELMLAGRILAGIGSSAISVVLAYVGKAVPLNQQQEVVGIIKYSCALARVLGPVLASIVVATGNVDFKAASLPESLFNTFTIPGWVAAAAVLICVICVMFFVKPVETTHIIGAKTPLLRDQPNNAGESEGNKCSKRCCKALSLFWPVWLLQALTTFVYWGVNGNLFAIAVVRFRLLDNSQQLWRLYIGGIFGFLAGFIVFLVMKKRCKCRPRAFIIFGTTSLFAGMLTFVAVAYTPRNIDLRFAFYIVIGVATFGYALCIPAIQGQVNIIAKVYSSVLGAQSLFVVLPVVFASISRLAGTSLFPLLVSATRDGSPYTAIMPMPSSNVTHCVFNNPQHYDYDGCTLRNFGTAMIVCAILILVSIILIPFIKSPGKGKAKGKKENSKEIVDVNEKV